MLNNHREKHYCLLLYLRHDIEVNKKEADCNVILIAGSFWVGILSTVLHFPTYT